MSDNDQSPNGAPPEQPAGSEHLNIKVTDGNNEVFFKIKKSTRLAKLMSAFCERQGKDQNTVRFLFDGSRVRDEDTPDSVSHPYTCKAEHTKSSRQLGMDDGDTLEVHQEQIGGGC
jgi:Ubiquitin-2 like Rad60 SUMO-like